MGASNTQVLVYDNEGRQRFVTAAVAEAMLSEGWTASRPNTQAGMLCEFCDAPLSVGAAYDVVCDNCGARGAHLFDCRMFSSQNAG